MKVLRPDPAEYIEDIGCGPIRPIDVLCGALGLAEAYGVSIERLYRLSLWAESVRDFDLLVAAHVDALSRPCARNEVQKAGAQNEH